VASNQEADMKISRLMNGVAAAALSSALALGQMGTALADDAGLQQQASAPQPLTSVQLRDMAGDYSMQNGGRVGIFINIAPDTRFTPEQIGKAMISKFAAEGIEAAYVYHYASEGVTSVSYYMNGSVYPGYDLGAAPEGFKQVVRSYKAMKAIQTKPAEEIVADALVLNN
jgi:hypothetical protein